VRRRDALKLGLAAGAGALSANTALAGTARADIAAPVPPPITVPLFQGPLPVPQVLQPGTETQGSDTYDMAMVKSTHEIAPGRTTTLQTFAGHFPGPTIRARRGRPVELRLTNQLTVPTATHLHGGHNAHSDDGYPLDTVAPGGTRTYRYPNEQQAASLWYHDHAFGHESENVYRGLAGLYLLGDDYEDSLPLPSGAYDVPLMLRDAHIAADGTLVYDMTNVKGADRKTILVNGAPTPYFEVAARKYRFRIANAANQRIFVLKLADGGTITQIGSDGGLLPEPVELASISVWPAERVDVVIDFSRRAVGSSLVLENTEAFPGERTEVMRFDVVREAEDPSSVPTRFNPLSPLGEPQVRRTFELSSNPAAHSYLINGKAFDPNRIDFSATQGVTESWTVSNLDKRIPIPHTFHVHLAQVRITARNGKAPAAAERGLKDTMSVRPGETVTFSVRFEDHDGLYLYHCHMLEHAMDGMMGQLDVVPAALKRPGRSGR
jgi:spore coat protein A